MNTQYESAIKAAKEYAEGLALKPQIQELNVRSLAEKFGCSRKTVQAIQRGLTPTDVLNEDLELIRECVRHRREMEAKRRGKTLEAVAAKYHVAKTTVKDYLEDLDG